MSTTVMTKRAARIIGGVYLLFFLTSILSDSLIKGLIVPSDAATTAARILAHEARFRLGVATGLIETAFYIALTALFYELFRPVSRSVSIVAAFFGLVGCALQAGGSVFQVFSLRALDSGVHAAHLTAEQVPGLALLSLQLNDQARNVALVFFWAYCLLMGWLILGSTFLPRALGVLRVLAGIGWLTFLYPPLADRLFAFVAVMGI